mgnify:FL=1|tara:strand:- start:3553 stop:4743 length:1191 start_codon:yes stop_codon:yes gene_type:complete
MIDKSVIVACLKKDNYNRVSNLIKKDYFPKEIGTIIDVINKLHKKYDNDISLEDVMLSHRDSFPAMPEATRLRVERDINSLFTVKVQDELVADILHNFWKRTKAKQIGEQALDIFLGKSGDTSPLLSSVEDLKNNEVKLSNTYSVLNEDIETSLNEFEREPEFKFPSQIRDYVTGIDRQNLGVIFARPEIGKTSFAAWLCGWYVKNNLNVAYWGNEEPVRKTRMRVAKSIFELSRQEILLDRNSFIENYRHKVLPYATFMDCVGTSIQEIEDYCFRNEVDVVFIDQLDKVRIDGEFSRGDERLKELYARSRELAKRNKVAVWAVSQASYEAHGREIIDYSMLDGSKTGKAGEADIIIGIGVSEHEDFRTLKFSKNKINGYHGSIVLRRDGDRDIFL